MERQGFLVLPGKKEPASAKLKSRDMQALRGETLQLAVENTELEDQLEKFRREGKRLREEKGQVGGFHWKNGQTGALTLPSNAVPRQGSKVGSVSGKVRIRVLKEQVEEVKKVIPVSSPQTKWVTEMKRVKKCGQCENKPALLMCVECGEDFCVPCFSKMHHKGALRSHRSHPIQRSESATLTLTPDLIQRFKQRMGMAADGQATREQGFPRISHATPPSNPRAQDNGMAFPPSLPPSMRKLEGRASGFGERGLEGGAHSRRHMGLVDAAATQGVREARRASGPHDVPLRREDCGRGASGGSLLDGNFCEEESSRGFQEAVAAWRGAAVPAAAGTEEAARTSVSVSVEAREQTSLPGTAVLSLDFSENPALSYMDRLLLKKHRRTRIEGLGAEVADWRISDRDCIQHDQGDDNVAVSENLEERKYAEIFAVPQAFAQEPMPESSLTITEISEGMCSLEEAEGFVLEEDGSPVNVSYSDEVEPGQSAAHSSLLDGDGVVSARTPRRQAPNPVTTSPRGGLDVSERGLTTEPSEDLKNISSRITSELLDYQDLQGFFSIGLGVGGEQSDSRHGQDGTTRNGSGPTRGAVSERGTNARAAQTRSDSGAPLNLLSVRRAVPSAVRRRDSRWRADNSLSVGADAEPTDAVLGECRWRRRPSGGAYGAYGAYGPRPQAARLARSNTAPSAVSVTARPSSSPSSSQTLSTPLTPLPFRPMMSGDPARRVRMSGALDVESNRDSDEDEERIVGSLEKELALAVSRLHLDCPSESS